MLKVEENERFKSLEILKCNTDTVTNFRLTPTSRMCQESIELCLSVLSPLDKEHCSSLSKQTHLKLGFFVQNDFKVSWEEGCNARLESYLNNISPPTGYC